MNRNGAILPERRPLPPPEYPAWVQGIGWLMSIGALVLLCEIAWNIAGLIADG
jgi:hypothetical protein